MKEFIRKSRKHRLSIDIELIVICHKKATLLENKRKFVKRIHIKKISFFSDVISKLSLLIRLIHTNIFLIKEKSNLNPLWCKLR